MTESPPPPAPSPEREAPSTVGPSAEEGAGGVAAEGAGGVAEEGAGGVAAEGAGGVADAASSMLPGAMPLVLFLYGIVALFAFGFALFSGGLGDLLGALDPTRTPGRLGAGLAGAVGLGFALVVASRIAARTWGPMTRLVDGLVDLFGAIRVRDALLLALVSGFAEELLFRGALFPHLELIGTTLLFGLVHVVPRRAFWVYPLFATLAGLLFGILRDGTDSLWPPIVAHVTVNALNLVWVGKLARKRGATLETSEAR